MRKVGSLAFCVVCLLSLLDGCGVTPADEPTNTPAVTPTTAATGPTAISAGATAAVPGMPVGLCAEDCVVEDFQVWQDFMPSLRANSAPLHATVTLAVAWPQKITQGMAQATITLVRASGDQVVTSDMQLNEGAGDQASGQGQSGTQRVQFIMLPQTVATQLTEGEMLHGTVALTLGGQVRTVGLPEAPLLFTH